MKCPACNGRLSEGTTSMPYVMEEKKLIEVRGVPSLLCDQCGECYIESSTLIKVEEIIKFVEKSGVIHGVLEYSEVA